MVLKAITIDHSWWLVVHSSLSWVRSQGMGDSYGGRGTTNATEEKEKHRRKSTSVVWSSDSAKFAMVRSDMRKVADLWVVHAVGNDRCAAQPSPLHTPPSSSALPFSAA